MNDILLIAVPLICFAGAYVSTVASMGGGVLIVASCSQVLPLAAVVPLSSVLIMAGQVGRVSQFHRHIAWSITAPFIPGSIIGAVLGSFIYLSLPDDAIALLLGACMLWFCWVPSTPASRSLRQRIPQPFFWVGIVHTFLSTMAGVGGLFQSLMVNSGLTREAMVATNAGTMLFMTVFKTVGYIAAGFDYGQFLAVIGVSWIASFLGTAAGKHSLHRVPEQVFRHLIKAMVTIFSLRLFWQAGVGFLH